jgi:hypothetical protein
MPWAHDEGIAFIQKYSVAALEEKTYFCLAVIRMGV